MLQSIELGADYELLTDASAYLLAALTLEQKVRLLTGADFWAVYPEPAAGLRRLVTSDGPAGVRGEHWDEREPSAGLTVRSAISRFIAKVTFLVNCPS